MSSLAVHTLILAGLVLCISCACSHRCCEFIYTMTMINVANKIPEDVHTLRWYILSAPTPLLFPSLLGRNDSDVPFITEHVKNIFSIALNSLFLHTSALCLYQCICLGFFCIFLYLSLILYGLVLKITLLLITTHITLVWINRYFA